MASSSYSSPDQKKEDLMTIILLMGGTLLILVVLVWAAGHTKFVNYWTPKLWHMAHSWLWMPGIDGEAKLSEVTSMGRQFLTDPKGVSLLEWISYYNKTMFIPNFLIAVALSVVLLMVFLKKRESVQRVFSPQDLAVHLSHVFTGIAPVLHIRKKIAKNEDPLWARQVFPYEVLLNEKVNGKPMIVDGEFKGERAAEYFRGIYTKKVPKSNEYPSGVAPHLIGGRLVSKMLGRQVVDLTKDYKAINVQMDISKGGPAGPGEKAGAPKNVCFPDRFSNTGKVIFALLCAHAFGGPEGKKDYAKARDQLNNSARGAAHGFANLSVAQWIFDKYRTNEMAAKLFAIHHWEYTYLFELLIQSKRQGKCGHWEFMWLKPMNRILFYVMNTVLRQTPHTESAGAFCQHTFEKRVSMSGRKDGNFRIPMQKVGEIYVPIIYVDKAVKALELEWDRWKEGDDEDNSWWMDKAIWNRLNNIKFEPPSAPPPELAGDTAFDVAASAQAARRNEELRQESLRTVGASSGSPDMPF
jgi:hypothetical protein